MYYEFVCGKCGYLQLAKMPMAEASLTDVRPCMLCAGPSQRAISLPSIHMNEWVADGYRRTNEPPEENKPGIKRLQAKREREANIISYPGKPAKIEKGYK